MEDKNLYESVKRIICRRIFEGVYEDGDKIPPERELSEELGVSRVTVRKALKLLEEERIIARVQGSGTRVALEYGGRQGNMDIITLVAPAQNAFFSRFIDAFQKEAEKKDSLVLFKQKPKDFSLEKCLFQIYEKNLRNVVLWLEDMELGKEALQKLRGLGMNIVLFDTSCRSPYADAVCLDNKAAVKKLYHFLEKEGCRHIGFVGWDELQVRSVRIREEMFRKLAPKSPVCRVSWAYRNHMEGLLQEEIQDALEELRGCDAVFYSVAELGIAFERKAKELGIMHKAVMIDTLPGGEELDITAMEQDFQGMAEKIFDCLEKQNQEERTWKSGVYQISGKM